MRCCIATLSQQNEFLIHTLYDMIQICNRMTYVQICATMDYICNTMHVDIMASQILIILTNTMTPPAVPSRGLMAFLMGDREPPGCSDSTISAIMNNTNNMNNIYSLRASSAFIPECSEENKLARRNDDDRSNCCLLCICCLLCDRIIRKHLEGGR